MKDVVVTNDESYKIGKIIFDEKEPKKIEIPKNVYILRSISIFSFTSLFITSWLSLIWLYRRHFVFTFYRYIDSTYISYFPIQISSIFLYGIILFTITIISVSYLYYLKKVVFEKNFQIFFGNSKYHIVPIITNALLFIIGELTHIKNCKFHIYYYLGFITVIISIYFLINSYHLTNLENMKDNINIDSNNNEGYILNIIIFNVLYGILFALDIYYFFYVTNQIVCYFTYDMEINIFLGFVSSLCLGLVGMYSAFVLKNLIVSFFFDIVFNGIITFHFTLSKEYREKINLQTKEIFISIIFIIGFFVELIYLFVYKNQKSKYNSILINQL